MTQWTTEQKQVIDSRKQNILVSAAAGSGKTAVLVERIIQKLLDKDNPTDIDRIVVVTFTRAAAAEMRERILEAIQRELEKEPDNAHLLRQTTLVHSAFITTIDSLCSYIVRNYFYEIDVDPSFRIGDEGEMKLLRGDVMDAFMEEQYRQAKGEDSVFLELVEAYGNEFSDAPVVEMIERLYTKSQSYPWPEEWLDGLSAAYETENEEQLATREWFLFLTDIMRTSLEEARKKTNHLAALCRKPNGPFFYEETLKKDAEDYDDLLRIEDNVAFFKAFREFQPARLKAKPKNAEVDEELLLSVKDGRDEMKKRLGKLKEDFCKEEPSEICARLSEQKKFITELIRLVKGYGEELTRRKTKRNVLDFNDIEHLALQVLKDKDTHEIRPTALEFRRCYDEVMIDEYQDSNYMQEEILTAICRDDADEGNLFMVGDVKQSIYSFRQACPEIFMEKYARYHADSRQGVAIDLHKNFRSREEVLTFCNDVFFSLMKRDLGEIEYDEDAALYVGSTDYEPAGDKFCGEIIIGDYDEEACRKIGLTDKATFEAKLIADKMNEMMKTQLVTDKITKKLRPMRFSDVVILMRSPGKSANTFIRVLQENGIPAFAESKTGYYDTTEVETVLNLLRVMDNPYQDIPLVAVLHSPIFSFTDEEMAMLQKKDGYLIDALQAYTEEHTDFEKGKRFLHYLWEKRKTVQEIPIHTFLETLLEETGYLSYVTAMPGGRSRKANIQKMIEQAVSYEATSYKGLFHFVHYIEQLKKYNVDMGEASWMSENDDAVAVMSIHKSKGLEFPIVFVAETGRKLNDADSRGRMTLHAKFGAGLDYIDSANRIKMSPTYKKAVARAIKWDMYAEEMRILYVAMTRAKEKLILTGTVRQAEDTLKKWEDSPKQLLLSMREGAAHYLEWIVRATAYKRKAYPLQVVTPQETVITMAYRNLQTAYEKEALLAAAEQTEASLLDKIKSSLQYVYPYRREKDYKSKYSVSEIKHRKLEENFAQEQTAVPEFLLREEKHVVPSFISGSVEESVNAGALRGTAMHRYLECYDFAKDYSENAYREQLDAMCERGSLSPKEKELLSPQKLVHFLRSDLAKRMMTAAKKQNLFKEKPFVMSVEAEELFSDAEADSEMILVQGIIDAFFVEDGEIVLLDYKTDKVSTEQELLLRYETQLDLYAKALQRSLGIRVKEIYIYSFCLEKTILSNHQSHLRT